MFKMMFLTMIVFAFSGIALGHEKESPANHKTLSWHDLKEACANPSKFQAQRPPQNIKITCKDMQYAWVPMETGQLRMATRPRLVTSEVYTDKYQVFSQQAEVAATESLGACSRFKEVSQVVATERALTCDDILAAKGEATDFCTGVTNDLVVQNKSAAQLTETGRVADTCSKSADKTMYQ